jgi:hypothetical protein
MDRELTEHDLLEMLRQVTSADLELEVLDVSGHPLVKQPVSSMVTIEEAINEVRARAGLPEGNYALYLLRDNGQPVRLDPSRELGDAVREAGIEGQTSVRVVLAPELEGNA